MKMLTRWAALALSAAMLCQCAGPAYAQTSPLIGRKAMAPAGDLPGTVIYCDDGTGHAAACNPGNGGSGGPTTIQDGGDQTAGAKADTKVTDPSAAASQIALLKGALDRLNASVTALQQLVTAAQDTTPANIGNISGAVSLPTGAARATDVQAVATALGNPAQAPSGLSAGAQGGTVTSSAATATTGTAAFASGVGYVGPLTPVLGRPVRVILKGTWAGTFQLGTSSAANACAPGTINPLTLGGQTYGSFASNANEIVDEAWLNNAVYCGIATVTSGTLTYEVRQ